MRKITHLTSLGFCVSSDGGGRIGNRVFIVGLISLSAGGTDIVTLVVEGDGFWPGGMYLVMVTGFLAEDVVCTMTASEVTEDLEEPTVILDTGLITGSEWVVGTAVGGGGERGVASSEGGSTFLISGVT